MLKVRSYKHLLVYKCVLVDNVPLSPDNNHLEKNNTKSFAISFTKFGGMLDFMLEIPILYQAQNGIDVKHLSKKTIFLYIGSRLYCLILG